MSVWTVVGIVAAVLVHAFLLLFGGLVFRGCRPEENTVQAVELIAAEDPSTEEEKKEPEVPTPETEPLETQTEQPPDAAEIIRAMESPDSIDAPALEPASLSAIEQALNGQGGVGDFADSLSFSSGGRIGGTGTAAGMDEQIEKAFSLAEIDQKPRVVFQASPRIPAELRGKKIEGAVTVIFVVDATGKVTNARVEKSNHPAFDKPALEAIRQWKFEPALRGGARVSCSMRQPFRFPPS